MISRLRGVLIEKKPPFLFIEVIGLTYEVQTSMNTFYRLPNVGDEVILHTHFIIREEGHYLFGFDNVKERTLFRHLLKVNGIGAKVALAILSSIESDAFVRCIVCQDSITLQRLPGIGKKTAERLIIEMRDRLTEWCETADLNNSNDASSNLMKNNAEQDAISALIALGYKVQEAMHMVKQYAGKNLSSEMLIRFALKDGL